MIDFPLLDTHDSESAKRCVMTEMIVAGFSVGRIVPNGRS
jgi:hypothetical protein